MSDSKQQRNASWDWEPIWLMKETLRATRYEALPDRAFKTGRARFRIIFYVGSKKNHFEIMDGCELLPQICVRQYLRVEPSAAGRELPIYGGTFSRRP